MNRFYLNDQTKWIGRIRFSPGEDAARVVTPWAYSDGGDPAGPLAKGREAYLAAFEVVDGLRGKREQVEATARFTALGVQEALADLALTDSLPKLRRAKGSIEKVKSELAERRAKLTLTKPNDEQRKEQEEIRAALRAMTDQQRDAFLKENRSNPVVASAIANAIPVLSGVHSEAHRNIVAEQLVREHGESYGEISDIESALKTSERAVDLARGELREIIGIAPAMFEEIAKVAESNGGELPFRVETQIVDGKARDICKVYDFAAQRWRDAKPEEISTSRAA